MTTETATPNQADASTAFLRAARAGQIEKIISLLEQGVDINVSNANGLNAIHLASKDGHVEVVRELLQRGAAIDAATKKGNTALHIASLAGQETVVKLLVQNEAQVNIQSQNGFTPLYMAAQENHDGVVKFLLSNGANQSLATEDGFTPLAVAMQQGHEKVVAVLLEADTRGRVRLPALHIAAKKDDVKAANLLLENEHNPDVTSKSGFTPLHIAAHYGNESVARLLLAKGADVNCAAKHNICPLHVAAKWGKDNMVSLLCDNGANVEARTRDGLTPLHCAARSGHERVVEALLDRGAPITSKSKNGLAPLHMAAQGDHSEAARVLLSRRAPVDDVTVDYLTALHVAAHCGHAKVAKLLLDRNADANARALNGFTPLHIACKKNRIKVVELLLKYGASIQATTESGLTPLHVASFMGCMNIVIYLLQHEANPDVPTVRGETPLHLAARANQTDIIRILLRNGAAVEAKARERQTPLHIASRLGNVDIAVLLLQHGADVRAMTADHYNALHIAAKQHNHDVAAALIEHNAPLTATTKKGFTALHLAAKYGNLKVANLLLAHGASPDQAGKNGMTPLHVAAQYDQQAVANTLLEKGADAKAVAKNGHTPLHIASRKNQMETAATLLEYGALTNAESKAGFTPLHLAAQQGHTEMCSLLLEHGASAGQQARNGLAALHLAAQEDRVPVAQLLVKNGAEVDICTKGGYTPLHIASHYGQANMVRYLLENGASVKAETTHGYTALHHAAQQGHINIVNILLEHKADANATTMNGQTPLDIASKLGYVTVMETLKEVSEPSIAPASQDKYKVVAPETMLETFMSDSEEEGGEDTILNDQPYRYLTADDMKSLGDDSLPIDVTKDERTESAMSHKNIMEISQGSVNGLPYQTQEVVVKSVSRYSTAPEGYCYNVDPTLPNFLVSFLVDARGGALRGCRGGGVRVIVPPLSAQQPTRITCRYLKPSRINHMPPLMEGEALASRVLEMGPVSAKFLGPVILEVPHYASLRGKEREIVILRSDNGTSWREHNADATDDVVQDILHETLEIEETSEDEKGWDAPRVTRILTHDFPQYFAVISRIRQEVHAIGPEGGMVSSSVVPQVQAVFPQGALTKKIKVGLQAQIIDSELTAKLLGRGVAVSPVVTVEPRRRKFHKAITLSMPAPRPHTQGMTNQYSTSSAPTLRLLCSISGGTNRAHWEDVTENTPLTFVNDCVSFTTTVSARYWLIDCRHIEDATKMATELYREAIHVPFMARFVVYAKRTDECQAQLRMFCVTDDKEEKALERIERFIQVAKSRDVEVHEGKPIYLEFGGNLVPIAKSGEQLSIPFRAFRENRVAFPVMIKTQDLEPICRCQFMRDPKVPKGEPSPSPIAILNIMVPDDLPVERISPLPSDMMPHRTEEQELIWRQRLSDPRLEDICNLLGKDWVALAYELGVSVATVNQIQAKRITAAEQAQLMLKLWKTQSGTKAHDNSLELALCRIGRDDIIASQSELTNERRIQRNIYQERQASEEIEAYKAEEDNKLKESTYDDSEIAEHSRTEDLDQDEAKYSPEEKSILDKSEMDRTPTPSEESEEDEDVKRSVAERKEQITKKLSSIKIPASKQKKELREEIIEIKTQIKPDIKKFHDIEQQVKAEIKLEHVRSKQTTTVRAEISSEKDTETLREQVVKQKTEEVKPEKIEQFRKFDPSSPAKPTPKHLQRHMRNESMRFPSGDFSNVTITPRKSITIETETKQGTESKIETFTKEPISQKEIDSARVEEKLDDGERSPDIVVENEKDIAEATLKDKINAFETKILREPVVDTTKTVKLTKEALRRHTQEQEQGIEYTQAFVRDQSKQIENQKIVIETEIHIDTAKSVKETIQQFDSKTKYEDKSKIFPKTMRTDSTLVQVSSEEDSEFLKKSTDSETETESQTTVKVEKDKKTKFEQTKHTFERTDFRQTLITKQNIKGDDKKTDDKGPKLDDHDKKDDDESTIIETNLEKQITTEPRLKVTEEELIEVLDEKDVSVEERIREKAESHPSMTSTKSDISKQTKTDSLGSDLQEVTGHKVSQDSTVLSAIDKTDSLADLLQSTEKDVSFVSQTESKIYSKESKHRSDSLDETSQFSDLDDQMGMSPAHKPITEKPIIEEGFQVEESILEISKGQTLTFLKYETEHSVQVHVPALPTKEEEKVSPVISAKARQFIETVPEDDSVQECFFSKRIYSDSLEESDHTDSRRHSEADSLKSDQSDIKAKISSSDFDERAEYEATADSGSGFGDEKFEESIGFATIKKDSKALESTKQDSADSSSPQNEESDIVFKKVTPKRHSRTESVSITKLSDLTEITVPVSKHEFQMIVTEAEEIDRSDKDEPSDKISSESSREIEISDRKSSEGISDKISSEDAVTDKKSSSEEHVIKEDILGKTPIEVTVPEKEIERQIGKIETTLPKGETLDKDDVTKRQSVTSVGSGSVSELRLDEKRLSDAHSITESRDYTFEESEDDIGTQGTHVDVHREKVQSFQDADIKVISPAKTEASKFAKLSHGDSLDDVEGFPEDHVMDYVHKLPHIAEVSSLPEKQITSQFLSREREEQLKRENVVKESTPVKDVIFVDTEIDQTIFKTDKVEPEQIYHDVTSLESVIPDSTNKQKTIAVKDEVIAQTYDSLVDDKVSTVTETKLGDSGEKITITTMTQTKEGTSGERIIKTTITETITYPSGEERVSIKVSECIQSQEELMIISGETDENQSIKTITETKEHQELNAPQEDKAFSSQTETVVTETGEKISTTTVVEQTTTPSGEEITKTTITETIVYPSGEEITTVKVSESTRLLEKRVVQDDLKSFGQTSIITETSRKPSEAKITTTTLTDIAKSPEKDDLSRTTDTETIKYPSGRETVSTKESENLKYQNEEFTTSVPESGLEDRIQMMLLKSDELDDDEGKISITETQNEIGPNGEEIKRTIITETTKAPSGEERLRTTITEVTKYPTGEETISTRVTESVRSIQQSEQHTVTLQKLEQPTEKDKVDDIEGKTSTTETQTEMGPNGEEIRRTIVTETTKAPLGGESVKTTVTEVTKYPSGEQSISTRVTESVRSIQQSEQHIVTLQKLEQPTEEDKGDDIEGKTSTTETQTEMGPNGEEIRRTIVTETTKAPLGGESVKTTVTEVTKYPSGEESISTRVTESVRSIQQSEQHTVTLQKLEQPTEEDKVDDIEGKTSTTETQTEMGPNGEEIRRTIVTETTKAPLGGESVKTTVTEVTKYPSGEESISTRVTESVRSIQESEQHTVTLQKLEQPTEEDKVDDIEGKTSTTETQTEMGPNGEEIRRTIVTETTKAPLGGESVKTTVTEVTKYPSGEESISTRVTESVRSIQESEQHTVTLQKLEQPTEEDKVDDIEGKTSTTETQTEMGPNGEEIRRTIVTETTKAPLGGESVKTSVTEVTKYPSGEESISTRVTESVRSIQESEQHTVTLQKLEQPTEEDKVDDIEGKTSTTETQTEMGPNGEEIRRTIVTETTKAPLGGESVKTTVTEVTKYPSGEESISTRVTESVRSIQESEQHTVTLQKLEQPTEEDKVDDIEGKTSTTKTQTEMGPNGEEIRRTIVTETTKAPLGGESVKTTVTEVTKYPSGEESISTRVTESVRSIQESEQHTVTPQKLEQPTEEDKVDDIEGKTSTTETQTEMGPNGEEIRRTIVTETTKAPLGGESVKTTVTEVTKYPSGEESISTRVTESVRSIQQSEQHTVTLQKLEQPTEEDKVDDIEGKTSTTETQTEMGPNGEEIRRTIVTETTKAPLGGESVKTTVTEITKYPSGEQSISTRVSESVKLGKFTKEDEAYIEDKIKHKSVAFQSDIDTEKTSIESYTKQEQSQKESIPISKRTVVIAQTPKGESDSKIPSTKFDISKIRTDTLSHFDTDSLIDSKKFIPNDINLSEAQEITKEQVTTVIDDILQKGTIVASARSPIHEKDVKMVSKEILETEKRSYDAKVPHKEERRHSCISPAISLERIAESEIEMEEEISKLSIDKKPPPSTLDEGSKPEIKKSDSAMKQMADNIEIIIKQASEDLDISSEEAIFEPEESKQLQGEVSVDSIIEEAVHTVEEYLDQTKSAVTEEISVKKETILEDTKITKERPALMKSLSRDSGETVIMPKKKQTRTFSVQSSPDEVEEQIYTDSESDMDKAKVLEIIEPTSDVDGKVPTSSFDIKKIKTDSLDDADDFPEKEVEYFEDGEKYTEESESFQYKNKELYKQPEPGSSMPSEFDDDKFSETYVKKTHFVDSVLRSELASKSTTESSVTTVISTLTKSSDDDQKSVLEDGTSADLSKISGADLVKDPSKTSIEAKEESRIEDQTDDLSKKTVDLTKDYSKSSIDSKDTSRDFATNELSKDSTVDLTTDFSKASIDSVKETSRSLDEKTFSEEHSSFDVSKTLASDASDIISKSKEFLEEERAIMKTFSIPTKQEPSGTTEIKMSEFENKSEPEEGKSLTDKEDETSEIEKYQKEEGSEVPDIKELNRRCSNLLEDISAQGALIRIDSTHVTHDLSSKFSKTPPPSPVDLIMKERVKRDETVIDKTTVLLPKGSDSSFLDASRQSPRASSAGDSLISETEAHQSELLTEASKALSAAAIPKSPTKHVAENITFVNIDKPTITMGAQELVDRTIEKSIDVIDQIKKEMHEDMQISSSSDTFYSESKIETSTSSSSIQKTIEGTQLKFQNIDPEAVMSDMVSKFGTTTEYSTVLSHKETETRKISGQEYFSETKQVSSSDDDSLIIKTETSHELRGQEHEMKEKMTITRDGDQTETSQKKMEKAHEATAKRSDVETKTVCKSTDDTDIIKVEREFLEQGLYTGRQTKSEEKMTALKDEIVKKKQEVKISERDLSHEQWGKEYFTQPGELEDIKEDGDSKARVAFVDSTLKIVEKDEILSSVEISEKGHIISSKVEHHKEESVIESKEHDDLSSDASHVPSFKSETVERHDSSEASPKSKSKSFKKEDEVYEVDFIKEIKVSTSPVKSTFSRTGSQDTQSESEVLPELPHDDKISETPQKEKPSKSPVKLPQKQLENLILEVSIQKDVCGSDQTSNMKLGEIKSATTTTTVTMSSKTVLKETDTNVKTSKLDISPSTLEITDDISTTSKDVMIKSGESIDTEYMVKSIESHEGEVLQKSMDSTVSAETLHASEFSTEADSAFLTGTDQKKEGIKLLKEKSTEDICSSGYDTDFSSAEFHGLKLETERVALDSIISAQPLADLSVLEKTIDEVKQSLEAAQGEIISEKSDGSIKYKQSPSEFQFKILISPDRPEVIKEEPNHGEDQIEKKYVTDDDKEIMKDYQTDSISQKVSSQEETTLSDEERGTVQLKESSPPLEGDISIRSDSGPHSILETESDIVLSDKNDSSKGSPEIKLRVQKHVKSQLDVVDRRSASEIEGWSSSGESHYQSFEHSESRPLSSDIEVMMTAQSGTDYETALTSQDLSFQSLRTSKDYFTAGSSLASRDSMRSLDSDASSHVASIDISDASETLVPSANELKEELMESSTYVEQFLHAQEKEGTPKTKEVSDDEISGDEECKSDVLGHVGKMKRSHEMRFQPKEMIPEHFPLEGTSESIEFEDDSLRDKEGSDTTISSQLRTDELLSSSISKIDISQSQLESTKEEIKETITKASVHIQEALPFSVTKIDKPQREFVDVESDIIPVGSAEYEQIEKFGSIISTEIKPHTADTIITEKVIKMDESIPKSRPTEPELIEIKEEFVKKVVKEISAIPFPITEKPPRQREFVDIEEDIIPEGSKQYEEILKSKSDSSVPKTKTEKSGVKTPEGQLESKQSSTSSLKTHEHLSTPQTPLSAPSQSSLSTDNGREYVLDDMYDISETPELKSDLHTVSSRSELVVTTEERTLQTYEKEQDSPTSDEFEMVDKPCEMDDFVVIEEVAKEAQETDPEGKSLQIKSQIYVKRHDTEVEEYLSRASKKQESTSSASGSLSDEELQLYELEQKRIQAQELAEIEAGKRWIQMQFEGDPRYDYERIPLEDIKEEEMTDFDASRIGSLSSQKESIGSYGSFRNSYGSLSESEMASRMRFRLKGENDDISISSLQEFENLERALMEQYNQHSSSQESSNGSLPRRYILSRSQGDDISVSSLKEFEGLESACLEALKAELIAKQKEALLLADPKVVSGSFLEQEKRSYDSSCESSPPLKSSGSPGQKSGSPSQKSGSPSQKVGSYGSPSQRLLADSAAIRKLIDQQLALEQRMQESRPKVVVVKKSDERGSFFLAEPLPSTSEDKSCEVEEECKKATTFTCAAAPSDGSAESIPGDCEEMMKIMDLEEKSKEQTEQKDTTQQSTESGVIEIVRTTTVIQQKFVDGKKVSETIRSLDNEGAIDIPTKSKQYDDSAMSFSSEMSSSLASQPSEMDSLMTIIETYPSETEIVTYNKHTIITSERHEDKTEEFDFSREGSAVRELSPSSGRSVAHSIVSGKYFTDPASGSWSGQEEELSSSGSFSRARADLMLGSTDSLEATSSNATRATYNYEVDTPMTGSLTSGAFRFAKLNTNQKDNIARPPGSNTMVSSLDTLDPVTAVQMESLEHQSTSEHYSQDYEVHEPDSDTERLEIDGRIPQAKERTIMFDSTDTLSAVSADGSVREATVEAPAATFYIGDTPIIKGDKREEQDQDDQPALSGSCPAALPPPAQSSPPVPAQRRSLSMIPKPTSSSNEMKK